MNNSMRDKVIAKINDRANEISSLMDEANEVLPKNTDIDGVKVMTTDDTVSILNINGFLGYYQPSELWSVELQVPRR